MNKKKWRDVKNALIMVVVMAAMMSTATYAWFTLTSTAGVTGMRMAAGGASGLKVSLDGIAWFDAVDLRDALVNADAEELKSITQLTVGPDATGGANATGEIDTMYAEQFYAPVYADGVPDSVTSVTPVESADVENYAAVYKFWIKSEGETQNVALLLANQNDITEDTLDATLGLENGALKTDGSFLVNVGGIEGGYYAKDAVRIGFKASNESGMIVWEPNANHHNDTPGDNLDDTDVDVYDASFSTKVEGMMLDSNDTQTPALFEVDAENGIEITMYVWLEGKDQDCINEIRADQLAGQLEFIAIENP